MNEAAVEKHQAHGLVLLWLTYVLYLMGLPSIIGVIINYFEARRMRREKSQQAFDVDGYTVLIDSHHQWLLRTFVSSFIMLLMAVGTFYYGAGYAIAAIAGVWWLYRVLRGIVNLLRHKPMYVNQKT
jgi:uncharacterized membrane protein